jgi:hypothetical protein
MHLPEIFYLAAALLVGTAAPSPAESGDTPKNADLAKLKAEFLAQMREELTPAGKQYLAELQKLERKFALDGKYEAAIATRNEHDTAQKFLAVNSTAVAAAPPKESGPRVEETEIPSTGGIQLTLVAAMLSDGATLAEGAINLYSNGAAASWLRGSIEPGGYEILVTYRAATDTTVQAKESFFRLNAQLPATPGNSTVTTSLGTLKITSRSDRITLTHTGANEASKLAIQSIRIISAKD